MVRRRLPSRQHIQASWQATRPTGRPRPHLQWRCRHCINSCRSRWPAHHLPRAQEDTQNRRRPPFHTLHSLRIFTSPNHLHHSLILTPSQTFFTLISTLLTLSALIYTFTITSSHANQSISLPIASANPEPILYPLQKWTPPNWFHAVLNLPLSHESDRRKIKQEVRIMRGWQWNLVPLLILGVVVCGVAVWEWLGARRRGRQGRERTGEKIEGL